MTRLLDALSSLKLTLSLLFCLSLISVVGTIWPSRDTDIDVFRYELFYQSPLFRLLLGLLALNMTVCTLRLLRRRLGDKERLLGQLGSTHRGQRIALMLGRDELVGRLAQLGYRVEAQGDHLLARRRWFSRYSVLVVHCSFLAIMLGGVLSAAGFVGTLNVYVEHSSTTCYDWAAGDDRELGFEFRLDSFEPIYYPIDVRFSAIDAETGQVRREYTTREGETVELPVEGWTATVEHFDPLEKRMYLRIFRQGLNVAAYQATPGSQEGNQVLAGMVFAPTAFKDPVLKQMRSGVSILEQGKVVKQGEIKVNQPLVYRGVAIFQTAFNRDQFGFYYGGFQFSRDPGEPLVWAGSILLVLGLMVNLTLRPKAFGLAKDEEGWSLTPLLGFRGEAGHEEVTRLVTVLSNDEAEPTALR